MFKRVLILAPHADDEILGCGGTIARFIDDGINVTVVIMTNASIGAPELFSQESIEIVRQEAISAHKLLGVHQTHFLDFPAPQLEQHPQYKIANSISKLITEIQPDTLFLPHRGDLHLDHGVIFNAGMVAARPQHKFSVKTILSYETLSETNWAHPSVDTAFIPDTFITLNEAQFEKKIEAMSLFISQLNDFPHSRSLQAIRALAEYRGATVNAPAAEAFKIIRCIL